MRITARSETRKLRKFARKPTLSLGGGVYTATAVVVAVGCKSVWPKTGPIQNVCRMVRSADGYNNNWPMFDITW